MRIEAAAFDSVDCSSPGCPNEADELDGLCSYCRRHPPLRREAVSPKQPLVQRKPVCRNHPDRSAPNRGKYAYLCADCRAEKRGLAAVPAPTMAEPVRGVWPPSIRQDVEQPPSFAAGVVTSPSGVNRSEPDGKPDLTLVDWDLIVAWAVHMGVHVESKGRDNWRAASTVEDRDRALASLLRHVVAFMLDEQDEDHAAAVCFNVGVVRLARRRLLEAA